MGIAIAFLVIYGAALVIARATLKYYDCIDRIELDEKIARKQRWMEKERDPK